MKRQKAELYTDLSKNKSSPDVIKYFFTYNPRDTTASKKKVKSKLRKTLKNRTKTMEVKSSKEL
jgi:hypothetical protein